MMLNDTPGQQFIYSGISLGRKLGLNTEYTTATIYLYPLFVIRNGSYTN